MLDEPVEEENEKFSFTESEKERKKLKEEIEETGHFSEKSKKTFNVLYSEHSL